MKDHISNTKLEKGDHYYVQTRHKDILSWASYSTPYIELIQYGRRIGEKVFWGPKALQEI